MQKLNDLFLFSFFSMLLPFTQLDGFIARTWPTQKSALGSALDPLADKILISFLYLSLTYAGLIPGTEVFMHLWVFPPSCTQLMIKKKTL